jgi:hypothetical protein
VFGSKAPELKIKELELDTHALITVRPAHGSVPLVGWNIPAFTAKFNPSSIQLSIKMSASISYGRNPVGLSALLFVVNS